MTTTNTETLLKPNNEDVFVFPVSFGQKRLWFLEQLQSGSYAYNESGAFNCKGNLNIIALERSLNEVIRRHEILRTYFAIKKGEPFQVILPSLTLKLPVTDLRSISENEREVKVKQLIDKEIQQPFDLTRSPLIRLSLLQLTENEYILIFVVHHIINDGWSSGLFFQEIEALYEAFSNHKPSPLPELSIQYADFTIHQNNYLQGETLEKLLSYWQQQLKNLSVLALPTDRPRPTTETYRGATKTLLLPKELCNAIKTLSKQKSVTLFMTLLAAFKVLLSRYTQQQDLAVGTPIAGRNLSQTERLIGFFVNNLVLRTRFNNNPSFLELLSQVREVALEAYAHQDMPFEKLVEVLKPERDLGRSPLFQVMFVLQNTPLSKIKFSGVKLETIPIEKKISKYDLTLVMEEISTDANTALDLERNTGLLDRNKWGMVAAFEYNTDLFDAETIERMMQHFQTLLAGIVADPSRSISEFPILTEIERHQLLVEGNDTAVEYPADKCIHQLFEERVEKTPDAVAVVFEGKELTYQQLNTKANRLASYLQSLGVKAETLVGICVERSWEMVVGLLGILKAGGAYVPIDPNYPPERIALMLSDSGASVLLTQQHLTAALPEHGARVVCLDEEEIFSSSSAENLADRATPENLAYVIYTSGSTGKPKGVQISHRALANFLASMQRQPGIAASDVLLAVTTISFDIAGLELYLPLTVGARVVLASRTVATDGIQLAEKISTSGATVMQATPATWRLLLASGWRGSKNLKILCGGEALPIDLAEELLSRGGSVWNLYGPTETTIWSTVCQVDAQKLESSSIPIGRPIANTEIYLLDRYLQPVPIGVPGELHIGGDGLARGYLNRPELTAEKFIPNPFDAGTKLYKTGDLARYLLDGSIQYIGRIDNQVKLRGFRIELGEIEAVLNQHPAVGQAVAIAREIEPGDKRLIAYIVPQDKQLSDESLTTKKLRDFIKQKLPQYMIPSAFVTLDALPLTPSGKIDRKALPAPEGISPKREYVAPRTPTEEIIANIFARVLGVSKIGINDNFFDLGGHSLLVTQLISRLRETFAVEIPIRAAFESPTVAELDRTLIDLHTTNKGLTFPAIQARTDREQLPLSRAQERLWFLNQFEGSSGTYNIPGAYRVSGNLDINALQLALSEIVRRHEVLRTSFPTHDSKPIQVINPQTTININLVDLQQLELKEREIIVLQEIQKEATTPFDLDAGLPLLRCSLLQLASTDYVLLLTAHHIVFDGWSIGIFIKELSSLYAAFVREEPSPLPELPIQYADFAVWQREYLSGEVLESQLNYWRQHLANAPELLQLPTDRPRPTVRTYRGATQSWTLNKDLSQKLQALSRDCDTTLFMTLLAAFATLLYRYSGQSDILIGSPIANRNRSEIESLIGFFVNTLVLRTTFVNRPSFEDLLAQVKETTLKAYQYQDVPFEQVVEALQPERSLSYSPLFQVVFILQNAPMGEVELPGVSLSWIERQSTIAKFDLTLSMRETESGLVGEWEYNTDLFDGSTIERMACHFQNLILGIVENPSQKIDKLPLVSKAERHQLLAEWNDTAVEYPIEKCIHQLFEERVEKTPDAVAVVFEGKELTYQQLNTKANRLASYLQSLGVKAETLVGICVERSWEMVVGLLGILKAGGAYVPIDPNYPPERIALMLSDSGASVLLTQQHLTAALPEHGARVVCLDEEEIFSSSSAENLADRATPENLAYVIYTSGSTGKPKGVQISHRALANFLASMEQKPGIAASDVLLAVTTISFDIAGLELYLPLTVGARVVLASRTAATDGIQLAEKISTSGATLMQATPATWRLLLASGWRGCPGLKILCGGEALPVDLAKELLSRGGSVWNLYGPTETTIWSAVCEVDAQKLEGSAIPIGRPIANTQIYLLDASQTPVPVGVSGELYIGGAGLARGYLNRPELTAEKFIPNPFDAGTKLYKTGDLARYLLDGSIQYIGRIDNQVKLRGFRIELGEIEAVLNQHPAVGQAVAIAREIAPGDKRLVAYIVPLEKQLEQQLSTETLRNFLKARLPEYMIPSAFVLLDAFPLTPNGKIDRRALKTPTDFGTAAENFVAPRTPVEEKIAAIWSEVLGIERISVRDNFFAIGGHSLLIVRVQSRLREAFDSNISVVELFKHSTISELAKIIEGASATSRAESIQPVSRELDLPLSYNQQRLWFLDKLENNPAAYNMFLSARLDGVLDLEALEKAFAEMVRRQEILRTSFKMADGEPMQVIAAETDFTLSVVDLRELPASDREGRVREFAVTEARRPFDLSQNPLLRVSLLQLTDAESVLVLVIHHIIADDWSAEIIFRELAALYAAFSRGEREAYRAASRSPLPELSIQYADFACWQREFLQGERLAELLAYWKQQLAGVPPILALPADKPRPQVPTNCGATATFQLPPAVSESIKNLARSEGVTLFMTLLAGFQTLLYAYSRQEDFCIGSPIANRNLRETEEIIGFFVNTLVLRADVSENPTFRELLGRVKEVAIAAYAHQNLPFEKLLQELKIERSLSHNQLFQVWFVLHNLPISSLEMADLTLTPLKFDSGFVRHDLRLAFWETSTGLAGSFEYKTDLFEGATINRMVEHLQLILTKVAANVEIKIGEIVEIIEEDKKQERLLKERELENSKLQKLKRVKRKAVK